MTTKYNSSSENVHRIFEGKNRLIDAAYLGGEAFFRTQNTCSEEDCKRTLFLWEAPVVRHRKDLASDTAAQKTRLFWGNPVKS